MENLQAISDQIQGSNENDQHNIDCRLRWKDIGQKLEEEGLPITSWQNCDYI